MCKQPCTLCLNHNCKGFAQILQLVPCENIPNCEITHTRVPQNLRSTERYCPDCRGMTKKQRKNLMSKIWKQHRRKSGSAKGQAGGAIGLEEGARPRVEQQTESSTMGASRGDVGGGFVPVFEDPFSTSEETEPPLPTLMETISYLNAEQDASQTPNASSTSENHTTGPDIIPIDPTLLHIDAILSKTGDLAENMQKVERFSRDMGIWIEPSDSKRPSGKMEK